MKNPTAKTTEMSKEEYKKLVKSTRRFLVDEDGWLYRRSLEGKHMLVVIDMGQRIYMMKLAHDNLGHRGFYATKSLIAERFWWPEMESDVAWYCKSCHICQERQKLLVKISPVVTHTHLQSSRYCMLTQCI